MAAWGELAGLGTAAFWALSSLFFTAGGRRVGSLIVNRTRLAFAVVLVGTTHLVLFGTFFPFGADLHRIGWLALSAAIGLVVGDSLLFQCYVLIGARMGVLLMSLAPVFGAIFAWLALGETLSPVELVAMALALAGVIWVVLERGSAHGSREVTRRDYVVGILLGTGSAMCQSLGLVTAKLGLGGGFPALSGVMIRMSVACVLLWLFAVLRGEAGHTIRRLRSDSRASLAILGGAVAGPFLGVWLSLIAVQAARVGIASTLMAMTPVLSLPLVPLVFKEKVSSRAVFGTLVAVAGVSLMIFA